MSEWQSARGKKRRFKSEINVVPYIDVMLVLLVIFMVAAPLISPSVVNLPTVGNVAPQNDKPIQVVIKADGKISVIDGETNLEKTLDKASVGAAVAPLAKIRPVVIAADKSITYEVVMGVFDSLKRAGIARVGLAVNPS